MKKILAIICVFVLLAVSAGCSSKSIAPEYQNSASSMAPQAEAAMPSAAARDFGLAGGAGSYNEAEYAVEEDMMMADAAENPEAGGTGQTDQIPDGRKIVKTVNMTLQTTTFDEGVAAIDQSAKSFGGYVQDSYVEGRDLYNERGARSASFTVRVPADKLDSFVNSLGDPQFNLVSKNQSDEDISFNYYDSKARLSSLQTQEERLLKMLETADELKYMLQVEQELANVRYQIESIQSQLGRMDSSVNLSTVYIQLQEVVKYEPVENVPVTFGQRIQRAFANSWTGFGEGMQNFAVGFVYFIPTLIVLCIIAFVVIVIVRAASRRSRLKKQNAPPISPIPSYPVYPAAPVAADAPVQPQQAPNDNQE